MFKNIDCFYEIFHSLTPPPLCEKLICDWLLILGYYRLSVSATNACIWKIISSAYQQSSGQLFILANILLYPDTKRLVEI